MRPGTLRAYGLGVITGSIVTAVLAAVAAPEAAAETIYDATICAELDAEPTVSTVVIIGLALGDQGYSGYDAGQIVAEAVIDGCRQHIPLMIDFANTYSGGANGQVI